MALSSTGRISMGDIRVELGIINQTPFSLDAAENGTYVQINRCSAIKPSSVNPASISEWRGYCHTCTCTPTATPTPTPTPPYECKCITFVNESGVDKTINIFPCGGSSQITYSIPANAFIIVCVNINGSYTPVIGIEERDCQPELPCTTSNGCPNCSDIQYGFCLGYDSVSCSSACSDTENCNN